MRDAAFRCRCDISPFLIIDMMLSFAIFAATPLLSRCRFLHIIASLIFLLPLFTPFFLRPAICFDAFFALIFAIFFHFRFLRFRHFSMLMLLLQLSFLPHYVAASWFSAIDAILFIWCSIRCWFCWFSLLYFRDAIDIAITLSFSLLFLLPDFASSLSLSPLLIISAFSPAFDGHFAFIDAFFLFRHFRWYWWYAAFWYFALMPLPIIVFISIFHFTPLFRFISLICWCFALIFSSMIFIVDAVAKLSLIFSFITRFSLLFAIFADDFIDISPLITDISLPRFFDYFFMPFSFIFAISIFFMLSLIAISSSMPFHFADDFMLPLMRIAIRCHHCRRRHDAAISLFFCW